MEIRKEIKAIIHNSLFYKFKLNGQESLAAPHVNLLVTEIRDWHLAKDRSNKCMEKVD